MFKTYVDREVCDNCGKCEELFRGFISKYQGAVNISRHRYANSRDVRESVKSIIDCCPYKCISMS